MTDPLWIPACVSFNDRVRAVATELDVPPIDLAPQVFEADLFYDVVHYNDHGSQYVANIVAAQLADLVETTEGE